MSRNLAKMLVKKSSDPVTTLGSGAPKCTICEKTVYKMEEMIAVGRTWHQSCFVCGGANNQPEIQGCKKVLKRDGYVDHHGEPYCNTCYSKLFRPKGFGFSNTLNTDYGPKVGSASSDSTDVSKTKLVASSSTDVKDPTPPPPSRSVSPPPPPRAQTPPPPPSAQSTTKPEPPKMATPPPPPPPSALHTGPPSTPPIGPPAGPPTTKPAEPVQPPLVATVGTSTPTVVPQLGSKALTPKALASTAANSAPKCTVCAKTVYKMEETVAVGRTWHNACFTCGGTNKENLGCKKVLKRDGYLDHDNQPYCNACFGKLFRPKGFGYGNTLNTDFGQKVNVSTDNSTSEVEQEDWIGDEATTVNPAMVKQTKPSAPERINHTHAPLVTKEMPKEAAKIAIGGSSKAVDPLHKEVGYSGDNDEVDESEWS